MKHFLSTTASALALSAVTATSALATGPIDPPEPYIPPVIPVMYDWSGGYVGLRVGVPMGDNFWSERGVGAEADPGDWDGTLYGLSAGYDMQRGAFVFGAALDYTGGTMEAVSTTSATYFCGAGCETMVENQFALRGRIGRAFDRTLVYATAGFASGEATAGSGGSILGNDRLNGWVAGLGIEHAVTDNFSLSFEYLYTDLGRLEIPLSCGTDCFTDVSYGTVRIGANFRF